MRGRDRWTAAKQWHTREVWSFLSTPIATGRWLHAYSDTKRGRLYTLDSRTGELAWTSRGRWADHASVIATREDIVVLTDEGTLIVHRRETNALREVARYVVADEATWAHPALTGGRVVIRDAASVSVWRIGSAR